MDCTAPTPALDLCDGADNDCDGMTDEDDPNLGQACDGEDSDECVNGTYTCLPDGSGVQCVNETVEDIAEVCNGTDDDCDGDTDENATDSGPLIQVCYAGDPSTLGIGACTAGVRVCDFAAYGGYDPTCAGQTLPDSEICDDVDNDCDGRDPGRGLLRRELRRD